MDKEAGNRLNHLADDLGYYEIAREAKGGWYLNFDEDSMEHMDFVWNDEVLAVLADAKVNGRVTFGSLEGNNAGEFWGYDFKDGLMTKLTGAIHWSAE
ncbi:MAG: hypothetical protein ACLGIY_24440 [Betaproteobacteria bacterium]